MSRELASVPPSLARSSLELRSAGGTDTISLLRDAAEAYPAWLASIEAARREVLLEMYWFEDDATGRRFEAALAERAAAGVSVYVIVDALGSYGGSPLLSRLASAGCYVSEFHPIAPWRRRFRIGDVFSRDHRKLLVIDGSVGFTGGINICDQAAPTQWGGKGWRDDAVRVTGPAVAEMRQLFFDVWLRSHGSSSRMISIATHSAVVPAVSAARKSATLTSMSEAEKARALARDDCSVQIFGHSVWLAHRNIRNLYLRQIRAAKRRVWLANAYFVPDGFVLRALARAAARGVDVRIIIPEVSDVPSVAHAGRAMLGRLLRRGVHVHLWTAGMMHTKAAIVDEWATVGSYNFDYRSLLSNLEITAASRQTAFVRELESSFEADLARTTPLDYATWKRRPASLRLAEWFFYRFRKLL